MKYGLVFLILILLLLLLPVKFKIRFELIEDKIQIKLYISYLFGLFNSKIDAMEGKGEEPHYDDKSSKMEIKEVEHILDFIKYVWNKLHIENLQSKIIIGTTNPFNTSILYGLLWSVKGFSLGYLLSQKDIKQLDIDIIPSFEENRLDISFNCIIKIKMVYIINVWRKFLKLYKGGGTNDRTSNRRINEVYNG